MTRMLAVMATLALGCGVELPTSNPDLKLDLEPCAGCYGSPCSLLGDCKPENICVTTKANEGVCCYRYSSGALCPQK